MRLFMRLLLVLPVIALGGLFIIPGPDGRPLMSWDRLTLPELPGVGAGGSGEVTVYKWQDADGRWHYGEKPQQGSVAVRLDPRVNLLPAARPAAPGAPAETSMSPVGDDARLSPLVNPLKVKEEAQQAVEASKARQQALESLR